MDTPINIENYVQMYLLSISESCSENQEINCT